IAAADAAPTTAGIVAHAVKRYRAERAVIDERLFQKLDVKMKGGDLKELMDLLSRKSGVRLSAAKDLEEIKLTVLMKQKPLRDLMRQFVQLFNLQWRRRGDGGELAYRYELVQDLRQRLTEEELRRKDEDQMLLNVVDEIEPYLQYRDAPQEELKRLADDAGQK